jgi:hypothetical protein
MRITRVFAGVLLLALAIVALKNFYPKPSFTDGDPEPTCYKRGGQGPCSLSVQQGR